MRKRYLGLVLSALVAAACTAPTAPEPESGVDRVKTVKVYSSLPLTGPSRAQTLSIVNGIKMAFDENGGRDGTNAKLGSVTVEYEALNDATAANPSWDAAQEAANARRASEDATAVGYIGTFNDGAARISIPILNRAGIAMISPANTGIDLTKDKSLAPTYYPTGKRTYFRVIPSDVRQGEAGAKWMKELGVTRVFVVDDAESYGRGLAEAFASAATRQGLQVVGREAARKGDAFGALATRIKDADADGAYYGGIVGNDPSVLVGDLRSVGYTGVFVGGDGILVDEFITQAGPKAEGVYATFVGQSVDTYVGKQAEWLAAYKARYGSDPLLYAIYGYEAASVLLKAIAAAGGDRAKVIDSLRQIGTNYDGALGTWSFDSDGDTSNATFTVVVVQAGTWVFSKVLP